MTMPSIPEYLKYANLQMAAEAFLVDENGAKTGQALIDALVRGNGHASKFTETQATDFVSQWKVLDQQANTTRGAWLDRWNPRSREVPPSAVAVAGSRYARKNPRPAPRDASRCGRS